MKRFSPPPAAKLALALAALALAVGCGGAGSNTVPVTGNVQYEGQPLSNAALTFYPSKGRPITAPIAGGEYSVELPPGEYRVTITLGAELPPGWKEGDPIPLSDRKLPRQFSSRLDTPLTAAVSAAGEGQTLDFNVP